MHLVPGFRNAVLSDMFTLSTVMRYDHDKRGIVGVTLTPDTLKVWGLSLHICSQIEEDITNACITK